MEPLTPNNQVSFNDSVKPGAASSPFKGKTPDAGIHRQNDIRPNLGVHNNPDMFVCPIEPFISHYGPTEVQDATVDGCMARLAKGKNPILQRNGKGDYFWRDFKHDPKDSGVHEDDTFKPLGTIVDAVLAEKTNELNFLLVPRTELKSDIRGSTHKIDGCFIEGQYTGSQLENREIKGPVEVKKKRAKMMRKVVHLQILGACHHVLNEDPRRMWIYGLTFENTMVSVWYFSRSHSVKSIALDWMKAPRSLVHILLTFARATPAQLGVDPTVHIGPTYKDASNRETVSYVYEVPTENGKPLFFKTGFSLVPQRPVCISGRNTRVWEVTQVTSADGKEEVNGKKVILKDVWLDASDDHSKTEAENMDAIFKAVDDFVKVALEAEIQYEPKANPKTTDETLLSDPVTVARLTMQFINRDPRFQAFDHATKERLRDNLTNKKYRSMFLTKLHAWKGMTSRVVGPDASRIHNLFHPVLLDEEDVENQLNAEYKADRGLGSENATNVTLRGPFDKPKTVDDNYRQFAPKRQSRFIYEEVCTTLQNLDTVGDVVDILCQTVDALHLLFAVGWVHRDISSNNIMAFRSGQNQAFTVKLADLEFARPMIDKNRRPRSDPRTGTPFFMPVEILRRKYLFEDYLLDDDDVRTRNLAEDLGIEKTSKLYKSLSRLSSWLPIRGIKIPPNPNLDAVAQPGQAVNHDFQHDLESVWWILLWVITCRVNCESSAKEVDELGCFKHDINNFAGRKAVFKESVHTIRRSLHGDLKPVLGDVLEDLREAMLRDYLMRPIVGLLELPESYSSIQSVFSTKLREVQLMQGPWRNMKLQHRKKDVEDLVGSVISSSVTGKRGRDASEVEPRRSIRIRKQKVKGTN